MAALSVAIAGMAQSSDEDVAIVQEIFGMEKMAVVAEFVQLEGDQKNVFWELYEEYETKRRGLGKDRLELLEVYSETYESMDDATTEAILKDMIALQSSTDNLISSYAKKIKKKVNVRTAAQFYQIEGYILSKIRSEILENIPVIGDM